MTIADDLRTLARNADVCADDHERGGLIVTPATAAGLWRAIAQLADLLARNADISVQRVTRTDAASKRRRGAIAKDGLV